MNEKNEVSRITIDFPKDFHRKLKALAAIRGTSMREMIIEYLKDIINECACPGNHISCPYTHIPNEETLKSMKNIEKGIDLVECENAEDLFKKVGIK